MWEAAKEWKASGTGVWWCHQIKVTTHMKSLWLVYEIASWISKPDVWNAAMSFDTTQWWKASRRVSRGVHITQGYDDITASRGVLRHRLLLWLTPVYVYKIASQRCKSNVWDAAMWLCMTQEDGAKDAESYLGSWKQWPIKVKSTSAKPGFQSLPLLVGYTSKLLLSAALNFTGWLLSGWN